MWNTHCPEPVSLAVKPPQGVSSGPGQRRAAPRCPPHTRRGQEAGFAWCRRGEGVVQLWRRRAASGTGPADPPVPSGQHLCEHTCAEEESAETCVVRGPRSWLPWGVRVQRRRGESPPRVNMSVCCLSGVSHALTVSGDCARRAVCLACKSRAVTCCSSVGRCLTCHRHVCFFTDIIFLNV